jgi:UDP:flavonoid glycosyltransferase YjiC (YdhE family)
MQGTPVLGLPSNFDQFLASDAISQSGAGVTLRARSTSVPVLRSAICRAVDDRSIHAAAKQLERRFAAMNAKQNFQAWVDEVLHTQVGFTARSSAL